MSDFAIPACEQKITSDRARLGAIRQWTNFIQPVKDFYRQTLDDLSMSCRRKDVISGWRDEHGASRLTCFHDLAKGMGWTQGGETVEQACPGG